ncbi:MAG TPA: pantoate--beta-alanine ligase [Longimicrobiales bacterium]
MQTVRTRAELRDALAGLRAAGRTVGFVPTMGWLHAGHLSLVDLARARAGACVMSVFVNPLQFAPTEDFAAYPRDLERDAALAAKQGVDVLFAPDLETMYPTGEPLVRVSPGPMADRLDGAFRPGHFDGVLTVVLKLFNLVGPDVAVFGRKDLQQAALIRRMVADLDLPVEIVVAPSVRADDGLALSSRNAYLSAPEREQALALSRALGAGAEAFRTGQRDGGTIVAAARSVLDGSPGVQVQYLELVDPDTLAPAVEATPRAVLAVAAFVGKTRLIDNIVLGD